MSLLLERQEGDEDRPRHGDGDSDRDRETERQRDRGQRDRETERDRETLAAGADLALNPVLVWCRTAHRSCDSTAGCGSVRHCAPQSAGCWNGWPSPVAT